MAVNGITPTASLRNRTCNLLLRKPPEGAEGGTGLGLTNAQAIVRSDGEAPSQISSQRRQVPLPDARVLAVFPEAW